MIKRGKRCEEKGHEWREVFSNKDGLNKKYFGKKLLKWCISYNPILLSM